MSRILEALKQLESRRPPEPKASAPKRSDAQSTSDAVRSQEAPAPESGAIRKDAPAGQRDEAWSASPLSQLGAIEEMLAEAQLSAGAAQSARTIPPVLRPTVAIPLDDREPSPRPAAKANKRAAVEATRFSFARALPDLSPYRLLANEILEQSGVPARPVLAFTVPEQAGAESFSLPALATALVEREEMEVLIVDGNVGHPFLSEQAGAVAAAGAGDVMMGHREWSQVVLPTDQQGISFAPIGTTRFVPAYAGLSPRWEELRAKYRLVLVDTGEACDAEAAWLVPRCDGAYLIVAIGETTREAALRALRQFNHSGTRILGTIATDAAPRRSRRKA